MLVPQPGTAGLELPSYVHGRLPSLVKLLRVPVTGAGQVLRQRAAGERARSLPP
jgi:hypothetical protein